MATFLRRKLGKVLEKDTTPAILTVQRPEGSIVLTKPELQRYTWLFTMVDSDGDQQVGGAEGALFLRRSGLSNEQLREVWRIASGGVSKQKLERDDWLVACKLVAAVQHKGTEPAMSSVIGMIPDLPIADFHYDVDPDLDNSETPGATVAQDAVRVTVTNPTQYGSGLSRHTRYCVTTSTSLGHFPRKDMTVWRRFSDFEWLHKRVSTVYPAAIIPLFPEKRVVGNSDDAFILARMRGLEGYMDKLAHHPSLSQSLDLLVFLDASDAGLEAAKCYIEAVESEQSESLLIKGVDMVMTMSGTQVAPPLLIKADEGFVQACAAHGASLARLSQAAKTGSALEEAQHRAADALADMSRALQLLAAHELQFAGAAADAARAVEEAAAASRSVQTTAFSGSAFSGAAFSGASFTGAAGSSPQQPSSADAAAAAAFSAHAGAAAQPVGGGPISAMFSGSAGGDLYSGNGTLATPMRPSGGAGAAGTPVGGSKSLPELLEAVAAELSASGARWHEQLNELTEMLLKPLIAERDHEAELGEAIRRRDATIDKVQEASMSLQRKKKTYQSLKPSAPDYTVKATIAAQAVDKGEKTLQHRKEDLERVTEVLKGEMARVTRSRRVALVGKLADYARAQAAQARAREGAWSTLIPAVAPSPAAVEAAAEVVAIVARKAEQKARAASAARAQAKATGGGSGGIAGAVMGGLGFGGGGGGAGSGAGSEAPGGLFADAAPIPSAADL